MAKTLTKKDQAKDLPGGWTQEDASKYKHAMTRLIEIIKEEERYLELQKNTKNSVN